MRKLHAPIFFMFVLLFAVTACSMDASTSTSTPENQDDQSGQETGDNQGTSPDTIFYNGILLTMEPDQPHTEAIYIRGDEILAVGSDDDILALSGPETQEIDLGGRTLLPGFIDSHAHWTGYVLNHFPTKEAALQHSLENGWTSYNAMGASPERLAELIALDQAGEVHQRVNVYLTINQSLSNERFGRWYLDYEPHSMLSPHVRVAGIKIFTDHNWSTIINWDQEELNQEIAAAHQAGWQIAIHTLGNLGHDMVLEAFEKALQGEPNLEYRHRIEHVVILSDGNLDRMRAMGLIASIQLNWPGDWPQEEFDLLYEVLDEEQLAWVTRWRDILDLGIFTVGSSDFPAAHGEEVRGAPSGSPLRLLHNAVTRIGNMDQRPDPWMLNQTISVEEALKLLTINGAYATFEEDVKGSLVPGKWADIVILSDNPLTVSVEELIEIDVLMTMIGGNVEYCAEGAETLCSQASEGVPETIEPSPGSAIVVQSGNAIEIALQGPATGPLSDSYTHMWNVAQMAIADYGLVLGAFPVKLVQIDDRCEQAAAAIAAEQLTMEHPNVVAVIGPLCSIAAMGSLPVYQQENLVSISGSATQEDLSTLFGAASFNRTVLNDRQMRELGVSENYIDELASVQDFYTRYESVYGPLPTEIRPIMAYTYDAVHVLLNSIEDAAINSEYGISIELSALADAVRSTHDFIGITGEIAFDEGGDRIPAKLLDSTP